VLNQAQRHKDACGSATHSFLTTETNENECAALPLGKEPPGIQRTWGWVETPCPYQIRPQNRTADQKTLVAMFVKFQSVPQSRAALQFGSTDQDTYVRIKSGIYTHDYALLIDNILVAIWCFSQTNESRHPQRFITSYQNLSSNVFSSNIFTDVFVHRNEQNYVMYATETWMTRYGLDGPGIESRWEATFSAPVDTGPRAHTASYTMGAGFLSRGVNRPGCGVSHPPPSSTEVKERVEPQLFSSSGPWWLVLERTLPLPEL
jgi:hypothetical protein